MHIESDLKRALRRESPPAGFAERVMARVGERRPRRSSMRTIAAAVLLTAIAGGWAAHQEIRRREGERARDEVMLALRIAGAKVRTAEQHVREIGNR
jgi:hypothetical protein